MSRQTSHPMCLTSLDTCTWINRSLPKPLSGETSMDEDTTNSTSAYDAGFLIALVEVTDSQSRLETPGYQRLQAHVTSELGCLARVFSLPVEPGDLTWMTELSYCKNPFFVVGTYSPASSDILGKAIFACACHGYRDTRAAKPNNESVVTVTVLRLCLCFLLFKIRLICRRSLLDDRINGPLFWYCRHL
jgi:hypothetical protein